MTPRVLIVDDEPSMAAAVAVALGRSGYDCGTCGGAEEALAVFRDRGADVVVTDRRMAGMDGIELVRCLVSLQPGLPVILMTAFADVASAVEAMRAGAFDYIAKPFDNDDLRATVGRAVELTDLKRQNRQLRSELAGRFAAQVIAESAAMKTVLEMVERVAASRSTVLLQGETGTGKEIVAKRLHYLSDRVGRPFVAVNCKAFADSVLESELFGHEKGAFTGARESRAGCFERADGGTLFLDEIGEVEPGFQAKILRVLQDGEVLRVGGDRPRQVDFRLLAATNRDLATEIEAGRFRDDLFFRLNVIPIQLPPLRERREDIVPLARYFLARLEEEGGRRLRLGEQAIEALEQHDWPGNVRELENAIERAAILALGTDIGAEDLLLAAPTATPTAVAEDGTLQDALDRATRERLGKALRSSHGRRAEAAAALGVDRSTLYRLMKRHGL